MQYCPLWAASILMTIGCTIYFPAMALAEQAGEAVIVTRHVERPPKIDGQLDDACWKIAEKTAPFNIFARAHPTLLGAWEAAEKKFVENAATAQICHDDQYLYIAYRCPAPADVPAQAKETKPDGNVWRDDCVEFFIDPMKRLGFWQLAVNAIGTLADLEVPPGRGAQRFEWDSRAKVAAAPFGEGFAVEIALPFASLGDFPRDPGTVWGVNFTRQGKSGGGNSTWAPVGKDFHNVQRFGTLIFDSRKAFHENQLAALEKSLNAMPVEGQADLVASAKAMIAAARKNIQAQGDDPASWDALRTANAGIENALRRVAMKGKAYILWQKDIWQAVAPDERVPLDAKPLETINVFAGQNTYASTGFLLSNLTPKPFMARLILPEPAKDKALPEGVKLLDAGQIEFRRGLYIQMDSGEMAPDALAPLPPADLVETPAGNTTLVWLEVSTHGLEPGKYVRTIEMHPSYGGFEPTTFTINLEVAPVDLARPKVKQWTCLANARLSAVPGVVNDLVRHGVTMIYALPGQDNMYIQLDKQGNIVKTDYSRLDAMIAAALNAGVKKDELTFCFWLAVEGGWANLPCEGKDKARYGTDLWKTGFGHWVRALRDHLFEKWFTYDDFVIWPVDEPNGDPSDPKTSAHLALEVARFVKQADPKVRVMLNPGFPPEGVQWVSNYVEVCDVLMPYRPHIQGTPGLAETFHNSGREIWTYHILMKSSSAAAYRNLSWQNARDGFTGTTCYWAYESCAGDSFNSFDAAPNRPDQTMDYNVSYGDFKTGRVIPGRRIKAWYQGNQDFRAITVCRELIGKLKAAGKDASAYEKLANDTIAATTDKSSDTMDAARAKLIRAAVEMQNLLKP